MSINITITNKKKITINNQMNRDELINIIEELVKSTMKECEMQVLIIDINTGNFHEYTFDYLQESPLFPKKWLLNNIIYSITCDETKTNINGLFDENLHVLWQLYKLS
jgi:hypothetical protein